MYKKLQSLLLLFTTMHSIAMAPGFQVVFRPRFNRTASLNEHFLVLDKLLISKINELDVKWLPLAGQTKEMITRDTVEQFEQFLQDHDLQELYYARERYEYDLKTIAKELEALNATIDNSPHSPAIFLKTYATLARDCFIKSQKAIRE